MISRYLEWTFQRNFAVGFLLWIVPLLVLGGGVVMAGLAIYWAIAQPKTCDTEYILHPNNVITAQHVNCHVESYWDM